MLINPDPLLTLSIVLVAGVLAGAAASRLRLPAVSGQILAGILLGTSGLRLFDAGAIHGLHPVTTFALGLIAVAVGNHLHVRRLRNAGKRLALLLLLESTLTPALVLLAVFLFRGRSGWTMAALLAAMAISTAPATIVAIVKETRSKGVFVKTLIAAVALNNIACVCCFEVARIVARVSLDPGTGNAVAGAVLAPFRQLLLSALLGGGAGVALVAATRRVVRPDRLATASLIAILFTSGLADYLGISSLLSCMFLGMLLANLTPDKEEIGHTVFENFESGILAIFFTLAGMKLDLGYALSAGLLTLVVMGARAVGKIGAASLAMRLAGATDRVRRYLGLALIPQAGVAVGLILIIQDDAAFGPIHDLFLAVGLTSVAFNEIIGPLTTRLALARSGDLGQDRARLIDFLHEENIVTDLRATSMEDAIAQLAGVLIQTNQLKIDRGALVAAIVEREREISTCLGEGLAVPHGELPEGNRMAGAMGISHEGLAVETPDGMPVHCVVLLATPPGEADRHLEVLAALARAVGADRNIQRQLYSAKTPAHAYELLHAEESEDFNYFLVDEDVA